MKQSIKSQLRKAGYVGAIHFRKANEFGTPDNFGPAIHRRWIDSQYDCDAIIELVDRDNFETVVIYLEPVSFYTHRANLDNPKHVWCKSEINGLRKGLGYCGSWSDAAKQELIEELQRNTYSFKISKDQSDFGIEWLKRTQFKLNGEIRAGAFIGEREAKVIQKFKRFEFVGLRFIYVSPYQTDSAPIYRTIARDGSSFDYSCSPMGGFGACYEVVG